MLESLLGSGSCEKILLFLHARSDGYPRQIARFWNTSLTPVQKQLARLQQSGMLQSRLVGRTKLYSFNTNYPFLRELHSLLSRALFLYPGQDREKLVCGKKPFVNRKPHAECQGKGRQYSRLAPGMNGSRVIVCDCLNGMKKAGRK